MCTLLRVKTRSFPTFYHFFSVCASLYLTFFLAVNFQLFYPNSQGSSQLYYKSSQRDRANQIREVWCAKKIKLVNTAIVRNNNMYIVHTLLFIFLRYKSSKTVKFKTILKSLLVSKTVQNKVTTLIEVA